MNELRNRVYVDKCEEYDPKKIESILEKRFRELHIDEKIKEGMTVVVKPNLIMKATPDAAATTHPEVLAAVGRIVKRLGARVLIAESSGGLYTEQTIKMITKGCGIADVAERDGFEINLETGYTAVELPHGKICRTLNVINPYVKADFIIDIAKLKTHCMTQFSGATKNLFGTVPGLMKPELHFRYPEINDFSSMLIDLAEYIKPDLCIIDGIDAMEGDGPTGGQKRHMGVLFTGLSSYNVDVAASTAIGINPMSVRMLFEANSRDLCVKTAEELEIVGEPIKSIKADFKMPKTKNVDFAKFLPKFMQPLVKKITTPKPKIQTKNCVGCGKCAESCPQHTIKIIDHKAHINYDNCIKCFCCHEMCPKHVIDVKRFSLFNL